MTSKITAKMTATHPVSANAVLVLQSMTSYPACPCSCRPSPVA